MPLETGDDSLSFFRGNNAQDLGKFQTLRLQEIFIG
jgi:hypothetical protein